MAEEKETTSDLFSSASLVAAAAKSAYSKDTDSIDKPKVAGAAADLLGAAKQYGKFDDKGGFGKYFDQAENYLQEYSDQSSKSKKPEPAKEKPEPEEEVTEPAKEESEPAKEEEEAAPAPAEPVERKKAAVDEKEEEESGGLGGLGGFGGGDVGGFVKLAQGFLK